MPDGARPMPFWIRCVAALAIAAFLFSTFGGLLGAQGWWQASGVVFAVLFAVVWAFQVRKSHHEKAAEPEGEGDAEGPK